MLTRVASALTTRGFLQRLSRVHQNAAATTTAPSSQSSAAAWPRLTCVQSAAATSAPRPPTATIARAFTTSLVTLRSDANAGSGSPPTNSAGYLDPATTNSTSANDKHKSPLSPSSLVGSNSNSSYPYEQGAKPPPVAGESESKFTRQYFYFVDHHGQLFLDDVKIKNFVTCFKDKVFLDFFFRRLRRNTTGLYTEVFPYVSMCGREVVRFVC
ncbi:hypothetical protein, variant [Capsaspora owczarzaki ATCC 30864]|uniref:Uncharacterized protein n=1 Tax=Capsaspora owczarzaki (strain ATCC 30864) TaxID=595528 RepID=A0A0D2X4Z5_CAPO3|nr:hypothetical protein, variant [Capsaspora owczarzaki ATCC 30864]